MLSRSAIQGLSMLAVLLLVSNSARALVIDDFSSGPLSLLVTNLTGQTVLQSGLSTSSVIGGKRSVYVGSVIGNAMGEIDSAAGQFNFGTDTNAFGYFKLTYGSTNSPLGLNLTSSGIDRFQIKITELAPGPFFGIFNVNLETGSGWKNYSFGQEVSQLGVPGALSLPFTKFTGSDLTRVRAIQIDVGRFSPASFISIDSITTIPEPATTGIIALSFILSFALRSRNLTRTTSSRPLL